MLQLQNDSKPTRLKLALSCESAHDIDAHFHSFGAAWHIGRHEGPVLGEGAGAGLGECEAVEVVSNCDHFPFLVGEKLKDEAGGEWLCIALDLFVEAFGRHAVDGGEFGVQF